MRGPQTTLRISESEVVVLNWGRFASRGPFGDVCGHFPLLHLGMVLASSRWSPGMLLDILQCTGQHPPQRMIWSQMSPVLKLETLPEGNHTLTLSKAAQSATTTLSPP